MPKMATTDNIHNVFQNNVDNFESVIHDEEGHFAMNLQRIIETDDRLPLGCTLVPYNRIAVGSDEPGFDNEVLVDFHHQGVNMYGRISLYCPLYEVDTFVKIRCTINLYNGPLLEINVANADEMYEVMAFCQSLLQFQPQPPAGYGLEYIRIPEHLMDHRFVSPELREMNLHPPVYSYDE